MPSPLPQRKILMSCTDIYRLKWGKILLMLSASERRSENSCSTQAGLVHSDLLIRVPQYHFNSFRTGSQPGELLFAVENKQWMQQSCRDYRSCHKWVSLYKEMKRASLLLSAASLSCSAPPSSGTEAASSPDDTSFVAHGGTAWAHL